MASRPRGRKAEAQRVLREALSYLARAKCDHQVDAAGGRDRGSLDASMKYFCDPSKPLYQSEAIGAARSCIERALESLDDLGRTRRDVIAATSDNEAA